MSLLLESDVAAPAAAPLAAPRRRPWVLPVLAGLLVLSGLAASLVVAAPRLASFDDDVAPRAVGAPYVTVPEYGQKGAYILGYVHGSQVALTLPLRNTGLLPITVTSVDLGNGPAPLLAARSVDDLPLTIGPGDVADVTVRAELTNCRYYHERAMEIFAGATIGFRSLGRTSTRDVTFDRPILLKGPMLVGCPGRKLDRSAENRSDLL